MEILAFTEEIIVPYFKVNTEKVREVVDGISDKESFLFFIGTEEVSFAKDMQIQLDAHPETTVRHEDFGSVGKIIFSLDCTGKALKVDQVSTFVSRVNAWVRSTLTTNGIHESIGYIYSILILSETNPRLKKVELQSNSPLLETLLPSMSPPDAKLDKSYIAKLVTDDFGAFETDSYRFSLHGGLVWDENYADSRDYIRNHVVSVIANMRVAQAFFEVLNAFLSGKIDQQVGNAADLSFEEIALLRESSLKALAATEYSRSFGQLTKISSALETIFGLDGLRASLDDKIDVLDSVLQRVTEARARRFDRRMSYTNFILTVLGILVALVALPTIWNTLIKLIYGK